MPESDSNLAKLTPPLARWCGDCVSAERRTVVIRIERGQDPKQVASDLRELGAEIESAGQGVITAVVSAPTLAGVTALKAVLGVEEPREFQFYT